MTRREDDKERGSGERCKKDRSLASFNQDHWPPGGSGRYKVSALLWHNVVIRQDRECSELLLDLKLTACRSILMI